MSLRVAILQIVTLCFILFAKTTFALPILLADKHLEEFNTVDNSVFFEETYNTCEHPLELVSVYNVSNKSLEYNFYSVGVVNIKETIYDKYNKIISTHTTKNITRDRIKINVDLVPGEYRLKIENADCTASSLLVPFVINQTTTTFNNQGIYSISANGLLYEYIPSENVSVTINNGRLILSAPETKRSFNGQTECKRFVLGDLYDNKLSDEDERLLFTEGLPLKPGNYSFKILYLHANDWAFARENMWNLVGVGDNHDAGYTRSAQSEALYISITSGNPIMGLTDSHWRVSWIPQYQILSDELRLNNDKAFAITRYIDSVDKSSLMKKVSHIQMVYDWIDDIDVNKTWKNQQALSHTGAIQNPDYHINRADLATGQILLAEYAENYGNQLGCPACIEKSEEMFRGIYQRFTNEKGVTSPEDTWLIGDYFSHIYGGSFYLDFNRENLGTLRDGLNNIHLAKSRRHEDQWITSSYFLNGYYDYRNYQSGRYLENILNSAGKPNLYGRLYNHIKANIALTDRKKVTYMTNFQEGLHQDIVTTVGVNYRLKFENGELMRTNGMIHSFNTMMSDAFYALLFGNGFVIWESNIKLNADPNTFQLSDYGGYTELKTTWKPNGGGHFDIYSPGRYNAPVSTATNSFFPEKPLLGDQGAWLGAKLYEGVQNRTNTLKWADYQLNGINITQPEVNDQIINIYELSQPIAIVGTGAEGDVLIYQNPKAGITESQTIMYDNRTYSATGNQLHVWPIEAHALSIDPQYIELPVE